MARIGSKELIRRFLKPRVGEVVTARQIQDAVGPEITEWARRLRELRAEGWQISSHNDRADLRPGEYVLEAKPPEPGEYRFSPNISGRLRAQVLERNGYTCQMCGIGAGDEMEDGRRARLHVGHIVDRDHGGKDEASNLRACAAPATRELKILPRNRQAGHGCWGSCGGRHRAIRERRLTGSKTNSGRTDGDGRAASGQRRG